MSPTRGGIWATALVAIASPTANLKSREIIQGVCVRMRLETRLRLFLTLPLRPGLP